MIIEEWVVDELPLRIHAARINIKENNEFINDINGIKFSSQILFSELTLLMLKKIR